VVLPRGFVPREAGCVRYDRESWVSPAPVMTVRHPVGRLGPETISQYRIGIVGGSAQRGKNENARTGPITRCFRPL